MLSWLLSVHWFQTFVLYHAFHPRPGPGHPVLLSIVVSLCPSTAAAASVWLALNSDAHMPWVLREDQSCQPRSPSLPPHGGCTFHFIRLSGCMLIWCPHTVTSSLTPRWRKRGKSPFSSRFLSLYRTNPPC